MKKAIRRTGVPEPITIDGSDAHAAAIKRDNEAHGTAIVIRQVTYLNTIGEQDHRAVKRVTRPRLGCKSVEAGQATLVGLALMHMLKKRQMMREAGDESRTAADRFYSLAARSAGRLGQRTSNHLHTKICDRAGSCRKGGDGGIT